MTDKVISLSAHRSARDNERRIFHCVACGSYSFKIIEVDREDWLGCANCEAWIQDFKLTRTGEIE